jgi:hypothetical protein
MLIIYSSISAIIFVIIIHIPDWLPLWIIEWRKPLATNVCTSPPPIPIVTPSSTTTAATTRHRLDLIMVQPMNDGPNVSISNGHNDDDDHRHMDTLAAAHRRRQSLSPKWSCADISLRLSGTLRTLFQSPLLRRRMLWFRCIILFGIAFAATILLFISVGKQNLPDNWLLLRPLTGLRDRDGAAGLRSISPGASNVAIVYPSSLVPHLIASLRRHVAAARLDSIAKGLDTIEHVYFWHIPFVHS